MSHIPVFLGVQQLDRPLLLQKFFKSEGLNLTLDGFVGNTFSSHRLVAYAETQSLDKADEVMGRLLHATHAEVCHSSSCFERLEVFSICP